MSLTVADALAEIDKIAPFTYAFESDRVGLQVGDPSDPVGKIGVSLDSSEGVIEWAIRSKVDLLVCHHPLIWEPMKTLTPLHRVGKLVGMLQRHGIGLIVTHTNWDCARGGINDVLAEKLGLLDIRTFGGSQGVAQVQLIVHAGIEFEPILTSQFHAEVFQIMHQESRIRLEVTVPQSDLSDALQRVQSVVPTGLEFQVSKLLDKPGAAIGRIGRLPDPLSASEFQHHADHALAVRSQAWLPQSLALIEWVGLVGGGAPREWRSAQAAGASAVLTGEIPQSDALEGIEAGLMMVAAGHYHTENPGMVRMCELLGARLRVEAAFFEPESGAFGRPI